MSTRIHKKVPLSPPLIAVAESITRVPPDGQITIRSRNSMILYFLAGEAMLSINGKPPALVHADSVAISPGQGLRVYSSTGGSATPLHAYGISFFRTAPPSVRRAPPHEKELFSIIKKAFSQPAILSGGTGAHLRQRLLTLRHAFDDKDSGAAVLLYTAALNLCIETARLVIDRQPWQASSPGRRKSRSLINGALEYMLRNLKGNPSIESIAWALKVSAEHLCRSFRAELGTTPRMALRDLQLDEAKAQLINSPLEIHRIAENTGFSSATTFCRFFGKAVGMTPTEYRAANRGNFKNSPNTR